jgi:hypothetical protein
MEKINVKKVMFTGIKWGFLPFLVIASIFVYFYLYPPESYEAENNLERNHIAGAWKKLSNNRKGKVIYAQPPKMFILDLRTGVKKEVPNIVVAGGSGRIRRAYTPRPFWSPDGKRFIYRYDYHVYVSDESGNKQIIDNALMDVTRETRWSWWKNKEGDWAVGPSKNGDIILVKISDPSIVRTIYGGGDVDKHCEITGNGKYLVYTDTSAVYITPAWRNSRGQKISKRQACRPCAAPDNRVAWLPAPHYLYIIHDATNGNRIGELKAPKGEEIYRLNWSNDPDFAVHMFGSRGNNRIHVRKVSTGDKIYIGNGWDPDLWVEPG